jgi:hypothetical protein
MHYGAHRGGGVWTNVLSMQEGRVGEVVCGLMYEVCRMGHAREVVCGLMYAVCRMGRMGEVVCGLMY